MSKTEEALLPCPFCGTKCEVIESTDWNDAPYCQVACSHIIDRHKGNMYSSKEKAIKAWNTRAPEGQTEEALLPIIAEMKGLIERQERHADEATTQGTLAKYLQIYVTKLEHLPRTPEGQEMWAVEVKGAGGALAVFHEEEYAILASNQEEVDMKLYPAFAFDVRETHEDEDHVAEVVPVIVTKKTQ